MEDALAEATTDREEKALTRWRPARRWYHPALAALVISASKFITTNLNALTIDGIERLEAVRDRGGRGLLTFSNHVSMFDDPLLVANFAPRRYEDIRWVAADALNFFGSAWKAWFFTAGKCVPIVRGAGVDQPGYHFLRDRLMEGDWVHIFPEGGRTRDPRGLLSTPFKLGIGRLVAEAQPIALPFYHHGMRDVLPVGAGLPRRGNTIRLRFGEPQDCDAAFLEEIGRRGRERIADRELWERLADRELWERLADWAYRELRRLEMQVHPSARERDGEP